MAEGDSHSWATLTRRQYTVSSQYIASTTPSDQIILQSAYPSLQEATHEDAIAAVCRARPRMTSSHHIQQPRAFPTRTRAALSRAPRRCSQAFVSCRVRAVLLLCLPVETRTARCTQIARSGCLLRGHLQATCLESGALRSAQRRGLHTP